MEIILGIVALVVLYKMFSPLISGFKEGISGSDEQHITSEEQKPDPNSPLQKALHAMGNAMEKCIADHENAVNALTFMAASDGKVSRQELRIIIGFCERMGTQVGKQWEDACEYLNSGLTISVKGGLSGAEENIAALKDRAINYRAAFLGAAEAIVASNRTSNISKRKLLDQARALI